MRFTPGKHLVVDYLALVVSAAAAGVSDGDGTTVFVSERTSLADFSLAGAAASSTFGLAGPSSPPPSAFTKLSAATKSPTMMITSQKEFLKDIIVLFSFGCPCVS